MLLQGLFSGPGIALVNPVKLKLRHLAGRRHKGAQLVFYPLVFVFSHLAHFVDCQQDPCRYPLLALFADGRGRPPLRGGWGVGATFQ